MTGYQNPEYDAFNIRHSATLWESLEQCNNKSAAEQFGKNVLPELKILIPFLHCLGLFELFMAVELFAEVARNRKELISMPDFRTQTNLAHGWTNKTRHTVRSSHPTAPVCVTPSGSAEPSGSLPGGSRPLRSGTELWSSSPPSEALSGSTLSHARSWPAPSAAGRLGGGEATTKR